MTTELQNSILENISKEKNGDIKFVNTMLQIVFGREVLIKSSITGNNRNGIKKETLNEEKLMYIEGIQQLKTLKFSRFKN